MQAVYRFKIASTFPINEETTFPQIAEKCGLNEPDVRRIVRHAIAHRVFKEVKKGVIAHTAMSKLLAEDAQFQDYVGLGSDDIWGAAKEVQYPSPI